MEHLMTISHYMVTHEGQLCELCDDLERVTEQEGPLLDVLAIKHRLDTSQDAVGVKTYPLTLLVTHFGR
jgi:hypothetical protein